MNKQNQSISEGGVAIQSGRDQSGVSAAELVQIVHAVMQSEVRKFDVKLAKSSWFEGPVGFVLANQRALPFTPINGQLGLFKVSVPQFAGVIGTTARASAGDCWMDRMIFLISWRRSSLVAMKRFARRAFAWFQTCSSGLNSGA
jgi:hypothetical protein